MQLDNVRKRIKIGITGINHLNGNRGVGALAVSTIFLLKKIEKETNSEFEITAINPVYGKHQINIGTENIKINNILPVNFFSVKSILRIFITPHFFSSALAYFKLNYILCMGEGDSFSDIYGKKRFNEINNQHKLARFLNKKYALLPQTIGPFNDINLKKQANKSIEKSELVFARDLQSYNYVFNNTEQKNVTEAIDVAFYMPHERHVFSNDFIHVGLNISSLLWHGGYTKNNQFDLKVNYQKLTHDIIDYFISIPNVKIHIVPHVVNQNENIENDYEISYHLVNQYNNERIVLAPFFLTPIFAKNYISGLDFFVGARMHSIIAAFSTGVAVLPLAYSRKFNGLFVDTLDYNYIGDMVNENNETILGKTVDAFHNRKELANLIKSKLDKVVKEKESILIKKLSDFLC